MRGVALTLTCVALLIGSVPAQATVAVAIDLSQQKMHVTSSRGSYDWPISSARSGFSTPGGSYAPTRLELMHYSHKFHMSPMPHAIFFRGGYAIHGTYAVSSLGKPASHGCVRLSPGNAALLYDLVKSEGARISITGSPPSSTWHLQTASRQAPPSDFAEPRIKTHRVSARMPRPDLDDRYTGYRYIGTFEGRRVYQPLPRPWSGIGMEDD